MPKTHKPKTRPKPNGHANGTSNGAAKPRNGKRVTTRQARPQVADGVGVGAGIRAKFHVPPEEAVMRTDPAALPEAPRESHGLFEIVPAIARRALVLGLSAREPSFHVFVAAEPEVMIEDDVVRYAARFSHARPTPHDIVYVHDFDRPEAPRPLILPPGMGPVMVSTMAGVIDRLKQEIPAVVEDEAFTKAQGKLASELEAKNRAVIHQIESLAKTMGFGVRPVHGGVQTFPILHGKPVSAEQFDVLDESTKRALTQSEEKLTREVEKAATLVRAQSAGFEAAREEIFSKAASVVIDEAVKVVLSELAHLGPDVQKWLDRVQQAL